MSTRMSMSMSMSMSTGIDRDGRHLMFTPRMVSAGAVYACGVDGVDGVGYKYSGAIFLSCIDNTLPPLFYCRPAGVPSHPHEIKQPKRCGVLSIVSTNVNINLSSPSSPLSAGYSFFAIHTHHLHRKSLCIQILHLSSNIDPVCNPADTTCNALHVLTITSRDTSATRKSSRITHIITIIIIPMPILKLSLADISSNP
ncbi:hypothetical protein EYC84_010249 [Monilinia fructicola]|uniref:Uncharacterized protein n=1 Tax=Monilinia fructicola TaxID=38448 RepID=A0A5M9JC62_MONFR|nr:hypothetical protein EYC84_010249 [Monilinia fructicola]